MNERSPGTWARRPEVGIGAVIAVALAIAFVVWLFVRGGDDSTKATGEGSAVGPVAASVDRLRELADDLGHPVYWIGPKEDTTYELTQTSSGRIFIRYLPEDVPVGIDQASYTIVGTYPVPRASTVLQGLAEKDGEEQLSVPGDGVAVYSTSQPTNVYLAYPGSNLQIEVFDPSAERARELVTSGQVEPVR